MPNIRLDLGTARVCLIGFCCATTLLIAVGCCGATQATGPSTQAPAATQTYMTLPGQIERLATFKAGQTPQPFLAYGRDIRDGASCVMRIVDIRSGKEVQTQTFVFSSEVYTGDHYQTFGGKREALAGWYETPGDYVVEFWADGKRLDYDNFTIIP